MACAKSTKIGFLGSSYFIGWVVALCIVPRIADLYGRKMLYLVGMIATVVTYGAVLICTNLTFMIVLMFFSGIWTGIRMSMGYVYMMEFLPSSHHSLIGTIHLAVENVIIILCSLYF